MLHINHSGYLQTEQELPLYTATEDHNVCFDTGIHSAEGVVEKKKQKNWPNYSTNIDDYKNKEFKLFTFKHCCYIHPYKSLLSNQKVHRWKWWKRLLSEQDKHIRVNGVVHNQLAPCTGHRHSVCLQGTLFPLTPTGRKSKPNSLHKLVLLAFLHQVLVGVSRPVNCFDSFFNLK